MKIADKITDLIGNTPLVKINKINTSNNANKLKLIYDIIK
jgi:cysteine synthase